MSDLDLRNSIIATKHAIIPIGSLEQHGEHLPVSTDSIIAEYIAKEVAGKVQLLTLPVISYGVSYEHKPMFNVSLHNSTLTNLISDVCTSLADYGIKYIVLLNCHHGNMGVIQYIAQRVDRRVRDKVDIYAINYWHLMQSEFDHGGEVETSLVLAIAPDLVKMNKAHPNFKKLPKSKVSYSSMSSSPGFFPKMTGNGIWGDPRKASVEKGKKLLDEILKNLVQTILDLNNNNTPNYFD